MGTFVHFFQFGLCFFLGNQFRGTKDIHRVFMVYANAALLPPAGGRLIVNWNWHPGVALGLLPFATMALALIYECLKGTKRSVLLSVALWVFIILGRLLVLFCPLRCLLLNRRLVAPTGLVLEMEGSQAVWFAAFSDYALSWDLMPWLGDSTYGDIHEDLVSK